MTKGAQKDRSLLSGPDAPQVGLEPTTLRLTAECSAIELLRNMGSGGDLLSRAVTSQVPSALKYGIRRRPTLPGRYQPSTIGTEGLNFCVRYGNRWDPFVIATGNGELFYSRTLTTAQLLIQNFVDLFYFIDLRIMKSSPRPISIIKLHTLPYFHR